MQDARRWVVDTCHDIERDDLVECAELGVSELVTNALLHGDPPDHGARPGHPRAPAGRGPRRLAPSPRSCPARDDASSDDDDLLLTFGRGLSIVARAPTAWGVEIEDDGKVVWFVPGRRAQRGRWPVSASITGRRASSRDREMRTTCRARRDPRRPAARLPRVPAPLPRAAPRGAAAGAGARGRLPAGQDLSDLFGSLDRDLREGIGTEQIEAAQAEPARTTTDLRRRDAARRRRSRSAGSSSCSTSPTRSAARSGCCRWPARPSSSGSSSWFLSEFVRQAEGRGAAGVAGRTRVEAADQRLVTALRLTAAGLGGGGRRRRGGRAALAGWTSWSAGRPGLPVGHVRRSTSSARSLLALLPGAARSYAGAATWRSPSGPGCSAGSPRSRRTPSRGAACWPTAGPGPRGGVPRSARSPPAWSPSPWLAPALDRAAQRAFADEERRRVTALLVALGAAVGAAAALRRSRTGSTRRVPWGTLAVNVAGVVPARAAASARRRRGARARPARRRLLRRVHDVLRLRGADPSSAAAGHGGTAYAAATIVAARSVRRARRRLRVARVRRSRGRAAGRRRCRSGGRPRGRR